MSGEHGTREVLRSLRDTLRGRLEQHVVGAASSLASGDLRGAWERVRIAVKTTRTLWTVERQLAYRREDDAKNGWRRDAGGRGEGGDWYPVDEDDDDDDG